jgi:hypothetical protein
MQNRNDQFEYRFLLVGPKSDQILYHCQSVEDQRNTDYTFNMSGEIVVSDYTSNTQHLDNFGRTFTCKVDKYYLQARFAEFPYYQFEGSTHSGRGSVNAFIISIDLNDRKSFLSDPAIKQGIELFKGFNGHDARVIVIGIGDENAEITKEELESYLADKKLEGQIEFVNSAKYLTSYFFARKAKENILEKYRNRFEEQNLEDELLRLISKICENEELWENQYRGNPASHSDVNIPEGVIHLGSLAKENNLLEISNYANDKHSEHLAWAHYLFRGRDPKTNKFYKILSCIDVTNTAGFPNVIHDLTQLYGNKISNDEVNRLFSKINNFKHHQ